MAKRVLCKFFAHGACLKGEHCEFSHDWKDQANNICTFYQKGVCSYGSRCRYDHVKVSRPQTSVSSSSSSDSCPHGSSHTVQVEHASGVALNEESTPVLSSPPEFSTSSRSHAFDNPAWTQDYEAHTLSGDVNGKNPTVFEPIDRPICSFAAAGNCPHGERCPHLHGDLCSNCGKHCLHPYRPDEREEHIKLCQKNQKHLEALRRSQEIECSVCLDRVLSKPTAAERKFGLLSECDHPFCISCIRNWRSNSPASGMDVNTALRACPICRKLSFFIIPSVIWYSSQEEKQEIVECYKAKLKSIDCKHTDFGNGICPFGTSCFYKVGVSTKESNVDLECVMDYSGEFTTDDIFRTREELISWVHGVGKRNGFIIVIKTSESGSAGRRARVTFACERSGHYRSNDKNIQLKAVKRPRSMGTKKCGCPFALKGVKLPNDDDWMLQVVCGVHNHLAAEHLEGHSFAGRLSQAETSLLVDMSNSSVKPKAILSTLKQKDPLNVTTMKTIYNARYRHKLAESVGRSSMQHLLAKLSEHSYVEWHRSCADTITDIIWAHPTSIDLLRTFPSVLIMDCTYKSNWYRFPLLEVVGVTSTGVSFSVALAYLQSEREDNYSWALERLRSLMNEMELPQVIVTDREITLMNAIQNVFPATRHLLCRWHINKNVLAKCKKLFVTKQLWEKFMSQWNTIVLSVTEEEYNRNLSQLQSDFRGHAQAVEYVTSTWLNSYKERFVAAWTDTCMHFGNTTTNRAESTHAKLKRQLGMIQGSFDTSWMKVHALLELQHTEIKASFENSSNVVQVQHKFSQSEFRELRGFISIAALQIVFGELGRARDIGVDASACGCVLRRTHSLPCAHELAEYQRDGRPIPLASIHIHWRQLSTVPTKQLNVSSCEAEVNMIIKRFNGMDETSRLQFLKKIKELGNPETASFLEPGVKTRGRGRPSKKRDTSTRCDPSAFEPGESGHDNYSPVRTGGTVATTTVNAQQKTTQKKQSKMKVQRPQLVKPLQSLTSLRLYQDEFPVGVRPHINHVQDVLADGNCGFRSIAALLGYGEEGWVHVRKDLLFELNSFPDEYAGLYGGLAKVEEFRQTLSYFKTCAPVQHWMIMPEMGHLIASRYNVVLYLLSIRQCLTFLPLRSFPVPPEFRREIAIGFVTGNHFVQVFLVPGHPVPPVANFWSKHHHDCAAGWEDTYTPRIERFREINGSDIHTMETPLDLNSD